MNRQKDIQPKQQRTGQIPESMAATNIQFQFQRKRTSGGAAIH